jgi:hypothetical protein
LKLDVPPGEFRSLTVREVAALKGLAALARKLGTVTR